VKNERCLLKWRRIAMMTGGIQPRAVLALSNQDLSLSLSSSVLLKDNRNKSSFEDYLSNVDLNRGQ
jgi:hypothetical protein